jgi:hypothetical protein
LPKLADHGSAAPNRSRPILATHWPRRSVAIGTGNTCVTWTKFCAGGAGAFRGGGKKRQDATERASLASLLLRERIFLMVCAPSLFWNHRCACAALG